MISLYKCTIFFRLIKNLYEALLRQYLNNFRCASIKSFSEASNSSLSILILLSPTVYVIVCRNAVIIYPKTSLIDLIYIYFVEQFFHVKAIIIAKIRLFYKQYMQNTENTY